MYAVIEVGGKGLFMIDERIDNSGFLKSLRMNGVKIPRFPKLPGFFSYRIGLRPTEAPFNEKLRYEVMPDIKVIYKDFPTSPYSLLSASCPAEEMLSDAKEYFTPSQCNPLMLLNVANKNKKGSGRIG